MRYLLITILFLTFLISDNYEDVIYLKNGSVIYGVIIETKPGEYYKIKSNKNIFVFNVDEIEIIKKELINEKIKTESIDLTENNWTFGVGLSSNRITNIVLLSKDFKLRDDTSFFLYGDLFINGIFGVGLSYEEDYNNDGLFLSFSIGQYYSSYDSEYLSDTHLCAGYQFRYKKNKPYLFNLGIIYTLQEEYISWASSNTEMYQYIGPVLSWEMTF